MKILSTLILLAFIVVVIIALIPATGVKYTVKLMLDVAICPILIATYMYWLINVCRMMNNL